MPNMSVADILKIQGKWTSSDKLISQIMQKMSITNRQAYRKIKDAVSKGEIKKIQLPDRSILYGLAEFGPVEKNLEYSTRRTRKFRDTFFINFFDKLNKISGEASGRPDVAFRELILSIATLPEEIKHEIQPTQICAIEAVKAKGKGRWEPSFTFLDLVDMDQPNTEFKTECYRQVRLLIDELSSILHKYYQSST